MHNEVEREVEARVESEVREKVRDVLKQVKNPALANVIAAANAGHFDSDEAEEQAAQAHLDEVKEKRALKTKAKQLEKEYESAAKEAKAVHEKKVKAAEEREEVGALEERLRDAYKEKAHDVESMLERKERAAATHIQSNYDKLMDMKHKLDALIEKHQLADGEDDLVASLKAHRAKIDDSITNLKKESGESLHLIEKAEAKHDKALYKFDPVKKEADREQQKPAKPVAEMTPAEKARQEALDLKR